MFRHKTKGSFSLQKLQKIQFLSTMAATLTKAKSRALSLFTKNTQI